MSEQYLNFAQRKQEKQSYRDKDSDLIAAGELPPLQNGFFHSINFKNTRILSIGKKLKFAAKA